MNHQVVVLLFAAQLALASGQQGTKLKPSSLLQKQVQVRAKQHLQVSDEEADAGVHAKYLRNALVMVKELASNVTEWDTNLSKSEREALDLIKDFIDDLSKSAIKSHDVDQREVNRAKGLIADCAISAETSLTDDVAPLKTRMHGSRKNHNACRTKEADCQSKEHDRCDKWDLYRKNTELSACADVNFHEHKKSDVPATKAAMEKCLLDLQPFYLKYKDCSKYGECVTEIAPVCDTNQTQFEKDFCIYHKLLNTTCQAQTDCREKHIAFRDATHGDVRANEAFRKADHITSQMVLCYFKVFESNNTNKSAILRGNNTNKSAILRGCEQLAVNTSQLDINYPAIPDAHDCDVEPRQPCDKDWLSAEYDSKMWKGNVTMLDCRPCPQATTTKTTTTTTTTTEWKFTGVWRGSTLPGWNRGASCDTTCGQIGRACAEFDWPANASEAEAMCREGFEKIGYSCPKVRMTDNTGWSDPAALRGHGGPLCMCPQGIPNNCQSYAHLSPVYNHLKLCACVPK